MANVTIGMTAKKTWVFFVGAGGVPSSDVNVQSSDVKSPLFNRWVYEKAQLIGMANFSVFLFFRDTQK